MPPRNPDLHGNAPDTSRVALVLVNVINDLEFEGGDRLRSHLRQRQLRERCLRRPVSGRPLSGFYATTLELLLRYLETTTLILTGLTGDRCVLFIASDAFMRDFQLWVPADCVASLDPAHNRRALDEMARLFGADLTESTRLALSPSGVRRRGRAAAARSRSGRAPAVAPLRGSHAPVA